jgi:threonyl-tRNA synthetase
LAPLQAVVLTITEHHVSWAHEVVESLKNQGFRVESDLRNEKIGLKIREHTLQRIPYLLVVGEREMGTKTVAVRAHSGADLGSMPVAKFADRLTLDIAQRGRIVLED